MSIYKECDIRGIYPRELDETCAYRIGRAIGTDFRGKSLAVGGDVRLSTPALKKELIRGLLESGADVTDVGTVPTPAFYYALRHLPVKGGLQVTASHNPPEYNGIKLMFGEMPVSADEIAEIGRRAEEGNFSNGSGLLTRADVTEDYARFLVGAFPPRGEKVVLDCGNGAMSELAPRVFSELGYETVPLFCSFDGSFPNRGPNPAVYENLTALREKIIETGAAFGAAFDGDGDRVVFADERGRVVQSERALVLLIRDCLSDGTGSVVYDQKSSSIVRNAILACGGEPRMERSGHAFIKRNFLRNRSRLAGEISGHFFFGELGYDDGLYAALKLAEILGRSGRGLGELVDEIPSTVITPDIRCFCPYEKRDGVLDRVREFGKRYEVTELDGVRVQLPDGWLLVRKSVTEESVTIRIEADSGDSMKKIKSMLAEVLPEYRECLG